MSDDEIARLIASIGKYLPSTVKHVIIRGDAEFIGAQTVAMCLKCGYDLRGKLDAGCPECGWNRAEAEA